MSQWTHITATISVDTYFIEIDRHKVSREINKFLSKAPKISGSEGNADVRFFIASGYNHSLSRGKGKWRHYQSRIIISIQGDLRDRGGQEVKAELVKFVEYIDNRFWIQDGSYGIHDEYFGSTAGMIEDFIPKHEEEVEE